MSKSLMRLAILSAPLVLTACGDGWEAQKTSAHFPYGNERTAGSGVVYVRAKMMPKKALVTEPMIEEAKAEPVMEAVEPVLEAEEIFSEAQKKGSAPAKKESPMKEDHSSLKEQAPKQMEEKHSSLVEPQAGTEGGVEESFASFETLENVAEPSIQEEMTAEDYIAQAPKRIIAKKVEVIKSSPQPAESMGLKTAGVSDSDFEGEEIIEVYENEVIQPQREIVVPKKDPTGYMSVGEETLNEIYNNDF